MGLLTQEFCDIAITGDCTFVGGTNTDEQRDREYYAN